MQKNMECILAINIEDEVIDRNWDALKLKSSTDRRKRIERCNIYMDQKRTLCGELLIQYYLRKYQHQNIELKYQYNEFGKPYIQGVDICFNISHAGSWVLCGFSRKDIGIDIEKIQNASVGLIKKCFNGKEAAYILTGEAQEQANRFTEMWTRKESYVKYRGVGLGYGLKSFEIEPFSGNILDEKIQKKVYLHSMKFENDYYVAKCCEDESELEVKIINISDILKTVL